MPTGSLLAIVVLLSLIGFTVVSDLRCHRIPNALILIGLVLGLLFQFYSGGLHGLGSAVLGLLVGFGLFLPFYVFSGMAAGDVKLMAMVGSFLGPVAASSAVALSLISGSVFGVLILLYKKQFFRMMQRYWAMASLRTYIPPESDDAARQRFPYAIAIFTGTLISFFWQPFGQ